MSQERAGQKWTDDETQHLIKQINESGLHWKDIAENHGRSILSVQMKAIYEYLKDQDQNQSNEIFITELSDKIKVSIDLIKEIVRKKQKHVEKQEKSLEKKEKEKTKYDSKSFGILWDFKIYLLSKYDFDDDIHSIFDDFVKEKIK